ncbi:MAG: hypothetical protein ACI865_000588 [Flavobacteriaceae bacterium]|jgi:hypothetical protein
MKRQLIFVYNAHTDPISVLVDYVHKVLKPSTYKCELCALTHHNLGQRSDWKAFMKDTEFEISFEYIKGFEKKFTERYDYPVVLEQTAGDLSVIMDKVQISVLTDVNALIAALKLTIHN